jgi:hypothetical protein
MSMIQRNAIYLLITLASIGFLYLIENKPPLIPYGIYLPVTNNTFPAYQGNVKIVNALPSGSKVMGIINMQMRLTGEPSEADEHEIMNATTILAKQNGADGIALNYFFASQGQGNKTYLLQAKAFRTN